MKKIISLALAMAMCLSVFTACSQPAEEQTPEVTAATYAIAGMKGPTTIGMTKLMKDAEANNADEAYTGNVYNVTMYGTAQEINPLLIQGQLDMAAVPANVAATLYAKTEGAVQVVAVNTLGVLYMVQTGDSVQSIADLKGKTIYTTGKGTTPEYTLRYILAENGIDPDKDVTIEYKSEATEVGALLAATDGEMVAMLPQPYVTAVMAQNDKVTVCLDMTEEWGKVSDQRLITGVMVARKEVIEANKDAFDQFLKDYTASAEYVVANVDEAAAWVTEYGIVAKEPLAKKAIPNCNITCVTGEEMKALVSNYCQVLFDRNPAAVGGAMPDDAFYYVG
ncbi:MAG: ABC transporter substrate-binding protein [Oscillospiraceae bacterium]|nr:ABC transporter substrate-binding protein [Oscillospiraceae bacterium]